MPVHIFKREKLHDLYHRCCITFSIIGIADGHAYSKTKQKFSYNSVAQQPDRGLTSCKSSVGRALVLSGAGEDAFPACSCCWWKSVTCGWRTMVPIFSPVLSQRLFSASRVPLPSPSQPRWWRTSHVPHRCCCCCCCSASSLSLTASRNPSAFKDSYD